MSVQTRRKTVHHHQRADPRVDPRGVSGLGLNNTTSPETPRSDQIEQNRHLEVASCTGNGNGATPSPQKRANNRSLSIFKLFFKSSFFGQLFLYDFFKQIQNNESIFPDVFFSLCLVDRTSKLLVPFGLKAYQSFSLV